MSSQFTNMLLSFQLVSFPTLFASFQQVSLSKQWFPPLYLAFQECSELKNKILAQTALGGRELSSALAVKHA